MSEQDLPSEDWLLSKAEIVEQPFDSKVPVIGPLIVWVRTRWNNVAARWYVRPLTAQQNEFNRMLLQRVRDLETYVYDTTAALDRDQIHIKRDLAALDLRLKELSRELKRVNNDLEPNGAGADDKQSGAKS